MTRVIILQTVAEASETAGRLIAERLLQAPHPVLGIATGSSPQGAYATLARLHDEGADFSAVRAFALDEYVGLDLDHPESYHSVVRRDITEPLGLDPARVLVPDGLAEDLNGAADAYEAAIRDAGGVDLQLLGLGRNGHIGFNEPGSAFDSRTRVVTLAAPTIADNARFFDSPEQVPDQAITQGIGTILEAEELLLLAHGSQKAAAVAASLEGPITTSVPGSALQLHPRVTVILDEAAASQLRCRIHGCPYPATRGVAE